MYSVKVNNDFKFEIDSSAGELKVDGQPIETDIKQINAVSYHILQGNASYNAEVVELDRSTKTAQIKVNGNIYNVAAKDQFDLLLDQLGMSAQDSARVADIKAPMPGLVLKIFVSEGDTVRKGDNLFVLEAMKMENIIKAPADVTVKAVKIKSGDKVEKGQVLMVF